MEQKGYFRSLTSLKGLFILIIAVHNTLLVTPLFSGVPGVAFIKLFGGALGNSMFFILSGFLLSGNYKDRIQQHGISFRDYMLRRLKKLYPMYILSNFAALTIDILRYGVSAINIEKIILSTLLIRSGYNSPTWFLCVLFVCYVLYFGICYFAKSPTHYIVYTFLTASVGYSLMNVNLDFLFLSPSYGIGFLNFFLGCILAEIYPLISEKLHKRLQPLFLVLLPLLMYLMLSYGVEIIAGDVRVCFSLVICPMIVYLSLVKGPCCKILQFKGFVALGNISSCIFFWHLVIYFAFCDLYALVTQGTAVQEPQYLLYFVLMLVISAVFSKLQGRKPAGKGLPV